MKQITQLLRRRVAFIGFFAGIIETFVNKFNNIIH